MYVYIGVCVCVCIYIYIYVQTYVIFTLTHRHTCIPHGCLLFVHNLSMYTRPSHDAYLTHSFSHTHINTHFLCTNHSHTHDHFTTHISFIHSHIHTHKHTLSCLQITHPSTHPHAHTHTHTHTTLSRSAHRNASHVNIRTKRPSTETLPPKMRQLTKSSTPSKGTTSPPEPETSILLHTSPTRTSHDCQSNTGQISDRQTSNSESDVITPSQVSPPANVLSLLHANVPVNCASLTGQNCTKTRSREHQTAWHTEIPTINDPSASKNYPSATGSIIVGIRVPGEYVYLWIGFF